MRIKPPGLNVAGVYALATDAFMFCIEHNDTVRNNAAETKMLPKRLRLE